MSNEYAFSPSQMYIYEGIISHKDGVSCGWDLAYFAHLDLAFPPAVRSCESMIPETSARGNSATCSWTFDPRKAP